MGYRTYTIVDGFTSQSINSVQEWDKIVLLFAQFLLSSDDGK
jgi:hypothetical protein